VRELRDAIGALVKAVAGTKDLAAQLGIERIVLAIVEGPADPRPFVREDAGLGAGSGRGPGHRHPAAAGLRSERQFKNTAPALALVRHLDHVVEYAEGDRILRESVGSQRSPATFNGPCFIPWMMPLYPP